MLGLDFAPDGKLIGTSSPDASVTLWDVATKQALRQLPAFGTKVTDLSFSPDGRFLATSSADGNIRLWEQE
jgi:WD40 repeat protein